MGGAVTYVGRPHQDPFYELVFSRENSGDNITLNQIMPDRRRLIAAALGYDRFLEGYEEIRVVVKYLMKPTDKDIKTILEDYKWI